MKFLAGFKKTLVDMDGVGTDSEPPKYWTASGNYCVNRVLSGSFSRAVAQGRVLGLVGPSGCLPDGEMIGVYVMKSMPAVTTMVEE